PERLRHLGPRPPHAHGVLHRRVFQSVGQLTQRDDRGQFVGGAARWRDHPWSHTSNLGFLMSIVNSSFLNRRTILRLSSCPAPSPEAGRSSNPTATSLRPRTPALHRRTLCRTAPPEALHRDAHAPVRAPHGSGWRTA